MVLGLRYIFGTIINKPDPNTPWKTEPFEKKHGVQPDVEIRHKGNQYYANVKILSPESETPRFNLYNITQIERANGSYEYIAQDVDIVRQATGIPIEFKKYMESLSSEEIKNDWLPRATQNFARYHAELEP